MLRPTIVLVTGVAGSGKSTVGALLAQQLGWTFADGDDFHSPANRAKMSAGQPLDDADRAPWLASLRAYIERCLTRSENTVLACSALKARYRATLLAGSDQIRLVHLHGSFELIRSRLASRKNHYMSAGMLDSQLAALEPPVGALTLDVTAPPEELVARIRREFLL